MSEKFRIFATVIRLLAEFSDDEKTRKQDEDDEDEDENIIFTK